MATNWVVLQGADIRQVLDAVGQADVNENLADTVMPGDPTDMTQPNRRDAAVARVSAEIRSVIQSCGRSPLSVTPGSVPPEAVWYTLVIAAWQYINAKPGLVKSFLAGDGSGDTPMGRLYKEAREWLWGSGNPQQGGVAQGGNMTPPTDPTGMDYINAVQSDPNSPGYNPQIIGGIRWGDQVALDTEYAAGSTTNTNTGEVTILPVDMSL